MITMLTRTRVSSALGAVALGLVAAAAINHAARAEGNDGMGTEAVVEALRQETIQHDVSRGWSNGQATLEQQGGDYSLSYAGPAHGGVGMRGLAFIIDNGDGNPVIEYRSAPTAMALTRR
ncbi:hypothetical protein GCM10011504_07120 [Siccirubricoccus deserti]|uniref:PepSY domain-containing protein n=1 Tax=Siccirubricoccus deserti TaxID=2013562 RepID=A0A9X0QXT9_9PROT|nr:hypothetical protein [Siccirubricoccus deserti]MBC4014612.1 hypothetical protein [Siccirubricoccus deserti]GGC31478.1 hypothetical protein GCM10011504_07120 [Siccirubricoccus deserti]